MIFGTEIHDLTCGRCHEKLTIPALFQDGQWWHQNCWEQGAHQLADASKIAARIQRGLDLRTPYR